MNSLKPFCCAFLVVYSTLVIAQDSNKKWRLDGYIKEMISLTALQDVDSLLLDNLIHNRLNFFWYPTEKLTLNTEVRTRMFHGDAVKTIPSYGNFIDVNNDFFDFSYTEDFDQMVFHTMIDRLYMQWNDASWQLKVGRQRINWGVNLAWNPNDIFNAYSLYDFDYEERPGTDALRFQKFIGYAGGYEIAIKIADNWDEFTVAAMYKWNVKGYDLQALGGIMKNNLTAGVGWAGSIGWVGFKGESSYFYTLKKTDRNAWLTSVSLDYSLPNSLYFNGSIFYNSYATQQDNVMSLNSGNSDVRSLTPYKWNTFLQTSYTFHPLFSGSLLTLVSPGNSGLFINPIFTFSPLNNFDLDLIGQMFLNGSSQNTSLAYLRLKYSF
ncbi:MAG: hypothetical protein HOK17_02055 [Flammeovirgaceae bacterium]|jgi:hypothetical protein|nr:hypothetical protein [Flammeovirgaceae bacterium]